ncbi:hypothetical protein BH10PSE7_BH10PSE7_24170 [soil metagenome]
MVQAVVEAPAFLREGKDGSFNLSVTFKDVSAISTEYTVFMAASSTADQGSDVSVPSSSGSLSVTNSPPSDYVLDLGSVSLFDDDASEGTELLEIYISASNQTFENGFSFIVISIPIYDEEPIYGTPNNEEIQGTIFGDVVYARQGQDTLDGGHGNDTLNGGTGRDILKGGSGRDVLNGDAGSDTASYIDDVKGVRVDLSVASKQNTVGAGIDTLASIENVIGTVKGDVLTGSDAANRIEGGAGSDVITGSGGADTILGGDGFDRFDFNSLTESEPWKADSILDLENKDRIDLRDIDADSILPDDQGFSIVGKFGHHAGELDLRYNASSNRTSLLLDVNGDAKTDMTILLTGNHVQFDEFIL